MTQLRQAFVTTMILPFASFVHGCGGSMSAPPPPTATISASANSVTLGQSVTVTWSSTNATSCNASATQAIYGSSIEVPIDVVHGRRHHEPLR
jgi:hypothetical protein